MTKDPSEAFKNIARRFGNEPQQLNRITILSILHPFKEAGVKTITSFSNIGRDSKVSEAEVEEDLTWLVKQGFVERVQRRQRYLLQRKSVEYWVYSLSPVGKDIFEAMFPELKAGKFDWEHMVSWGMAFLACASVVFLIIWIGMHHYGFLP